MVAVGAGEEDKGVGLGTAGLGSRVNGVAGYDDGRGAGR